MPTLKDSLRPNDYGKLVRYTEENINTSLPVAPEEPYKINKDHISESQVEKLPLYIKVGQSFPAEKYGDVIKIRSLKNPGCAQSLFYVLFKAAYEGRKELTLDFTEMEERQFPNACVPASAAIDYYKQKGIKFTYLGADQILHRMNIHQPLVADNLVIGKELDILSTIWKFNSSEMVYGLVKSFVKTVGERIHCSEGILTALDWCLNEVMDNVLQHSKSEWGYLMIQIHPETKRLAVCIADSGIGILGSLANSKYKPVNSVDAITLAVQEHVTRDVDVGQGNGLWGLMQAVSQNNGTLNIVSGSGSVGFAHGKPLHKGKSISLDKTEQATIVDFQLDSSRPLDIAAALNSKQAPINLTFDKFDVENSERAISIKEDGHGFGTRIAGKQMRLLVMNLLTDGAKLVTLDFDKVPLVTSSYADELVGKLVEEYGFYNFQNYFRIKNLNLTNQGIIQRAVAQRMKENLSL